MSKPQETPLAGRKFSDFSERRIGDAETLIVKMMLGDTGYNAAKRIRDAEAAQSSLVRQGAATYTHLDVPITNEYGSFNERYRYIEGCIPRQEFRAGIGTLFFRATHKTLKKPPLIFEIGKQIDEGHGYKIITHRLIRNDLQRTLDIVVDNAGLPDVLILGMDLKEDRHFNTYKEFQDGSFDLTGYTIDQIDGVSERIVPQSSGL